MPRKPYIIPVTVFAESQSEANDINNDLNAMLHVLKGTELKKIAAAMKNKPGIISKALKYL